MDFKKTLLSLSLAVLTLSVNLVAFANNSDVVADADQEAKQEPPSITFEEIELMPELDIEQLELTDEDLEALIEIFMAEEKEKAVESPYRFRDVPESSVYFEAVMFLQKHGVVSGYEYDYYKPWNWVNRAEMVKTIVEAAASRMAYELGLEDPLAGYEDANCFSDVPAGVWYTKYICFAEAQGWVSGYDDGSFKPGQYVSFVEALKISFMGFDIEYKETEGLWYKEAIARAYQYVYIPETVGTKYEKYLNRGELAHLIRMQLVFDPDAISELATWNFAAWIDANF